MRKDELEALFDQQAAGYDDRWAKMAPIRDALYFLLEAVFAGLPTQARILCVGAGTGDELTHLATRHPGWSFVAVEPSAAMLAICARKAAESGIASRCSFHEGYLDTLPEQPGFDGATCFLVSQFILDPQARIDFFGGIAQRLNPGGLLASSDLASDVDSRDYGALLQVWLDMMGTAGVPAAGIDQMRAAYAKDVAILPPDRIASLICAGGFEQAVRFHQAGLIQAWVSRR